MKIEEVKSLAIESIKVITFKRFCDQRGYFTEHYRRSDFRKGPEVAFMRDVEFVQGNESYSKAGTVRGLHFQWNPYMGKLVRTISGRMIDIVLDIRKGSATLGKVIMYDMPADLTSDTQEWIWVPPGFAHGNVFPQDTVIEYFCSGEYSQGCEAGISPLATDIEWSLCEAELKHLFDSIASSTKLVTDKDRNGFSLAKWLSDERSANFTIQAWA
jgi:dTDP-4-dehydrorhamnose 3,5-epimerase